MNKSLIIFIWLIVLTIFEGIIAYRIREMSKDIEAILKLLSEFN